MARAPCIQRLFPGSKANRECVEQDKQGVLCQTGTVWHFVQQFVQAGQAKRAEYCSPLQETVSLLAASHTTNLAMVSARQKALAKNIAAI